MRAPILALLLLALASSRQAFAAETTDAIAGVQANCKSGADIPATGASNEDCKQCVADIGNLAGLASQRMYACYDVCQSPALFPGSTTSSQCISCIENTTYTVQACKDCMSPAIASDATTSCFNCLDADPWALETLTQDTQYQRDQYFSACAQCSKIPSSGDEGAARAQCYECISTKEARLKSDGGFLTYAEYTSANFLPAGRANDFGACVYLANQSYLIAIGSEAVEGVYANCVPEAGVTPQITVGACIACMEFVDQQQANVSSSTPLKSYACADYCQNPDYYPAGSPLSDADLGAACISCLENENVTQAWACGNCMKTPEPTECFSCVAADPYSGNTSNYNWACGMCAQITDDLLRGLCMTCIQSQPGAGVGNTDATTEANICSCIDLIQNNTYDVSRPLTAMERSCFEPFQHYENGELVVPDIPWGNDVVSKVGTNNSECLNCMRIASEFDTQNAPGINKAYACHEYCQNPALVADVQQGRDCALCVISDRVQDPWACETCMSATNDTVKRQDCFTCLRASSKWPSHAWGCGQCAQFSNEAAAGACYQCLSNDDVDPCSCVDGVKNGTIVFGVQGAGAPADGPDVVCEHSFAALGCPDSAITGYVITDIYGLFYGRIKGDFQTCNDPTNQYCGSDSNSKCRGAELQDTCDAPDGYITAVTTTAKNQCVGRAFCNQLSGGYNVGFGSGSYTLQAENKIFTDPCEGVYKYMKLQYTCGPPASK